LSLSEAQSGEQVKSNWAMLWLMRDVYSLIWLALIGLFRSRASMQAEILTLRHQLNVLIGLGSRRRSASQAIDLSSDGGGAILDAHLQTEALGNSRRDKSKLSFRQIAPENIPGRLAKFQEAKRPRSSPAQPIR
jgi:hypothetical protein